MRDLVDVRDPGVLGVPIRLDPLRAPAAQHGQAVGDPLHVLLDGEDHVAQHGRAARPGDEEQIGEARRHQPKIGARTRRPLAGQRRAVPPGDGDAGQRARHGVEAGGEDDAVQFVLGLRRLHARGGDGDQGRAAQVHKGDVRAVERLEVAAVHADALGADGIAARGQGVGGGRVVDQLADAGADEGGSRFVRRLVDGQVVVGGHEVDAAALPARHVLLLAFLRRHVQRGLVAEVIDRAGAGVARPGPALRILLLPCRLVLLRHWSIAGGQAEVGGALEDVQRARLGGDDGDGLDAGRARADHADALAGEVHALVRPASGVVGGAAEGVDPLDLRQPPGGQAARRHDAEPGGNGIAPVRPQGPAAGSLVEVSRHNARAEAEAAAQVEAVGDVPGVAQDFRLGGEHLAPAPFLLQGVVEGVGVLHGLHVAARAGVAVPVPGAAHVPPGLEPDGGQAQAAQAVHHVQAGEPGADDDRVAACIVWFRCLAVARRTCSVAVQGLRARCWRPWIATSLRSSQ